jgi:predicted SAM-dependent methyltransferase
MDKIILDIGCGPSKVENSWGVDIFQYPEVDQLLDLNSVPWDLPVDHFETIFANHVIEHVESIPEFMNEVYRIAKNGATIHVATQHP